MRSAGKICVAYCRPDLLTCNFVGLHAGLLSTASLASQSVSGPDVHTSRPRLPPPLVLDNSHLRSISSESLIQTEGKPIKPRPSRLTTKTTNTPSSIALRHPPIEPDAAGQPRLIRTTQLLANDKELSAISSSSKAFTNKLVLRFAEDINNMTTNWTPEEWTARRRLVQFFRRQNGNVIEASCRPMAHQDFTTDAAVISCIFREDKGLCYITSVDTIYLLEALINVRFSVEEKNRIRRNLEGFKPITVSKIRPDSEDFFKLVMSFPAPKPRNIEKDVKVFPWYSITTALQKM